MAATGRPTARPSLRIDIDEPEPELECEALGAMGIDSDVTTTVEECAGAAPVLELDLWLRVTVVGEAQRVAGHSPGCFHSISCAHLNRHISSRLSVLL